MENQGQGTDNNNKEEGDVDNSNEFKSITDWWQQNSPMVWAEAYDEYISYITSMTEIYKEYIKSSEKMTELYKELAINAERMTNLYKESVKNTERMSRYWSIKFPFSTASKEHRKEKQTGKLKGKK
jgi:LPS O-antigen subunit length determinant protein (WzzB/FepE family)